MFLLQVFKIFVGSSWGFTGDIPRYSPKSQDISLKQFNSVSTPDLCTPADKFIHSQEAEYLYVCLFSTYHYTAYFLQHNSWIRALSNSLWNTLKKKICMVIQWCQMYDWNIIIFINFSQTVRVSGSWGWFLEMTYFILFYKIIILHIAAIVK